MTWVILAFLSHLVFIPGLYDGFSLPKRVYVFGLGIAAIIFLFTRRREFPLVGLISSYLFVSMIPFLWLANLPVFAERVALDVTSFAIFWAVAMSNFKRKGEAAIVFAYAVAAVVLSAEILYPLTHGTMGNAKYTAFVAAQAAPLMLARLSPGHVLGAVIFLILSEGSRAAFGAATLSLFAYGLAKRFNCARALFVAALLIMVLTPLAVITFDLNLYRTPLWKNSLAMSDSARVVFFGLGRGQFEVQYPPYANKRQMDNEMGVQREAAKVSEFKPDQVTIAFVTQGHPHNEFFNSMLETGVVGTGLFLIILFSIANMARPKDAFALALLCSIMVTVLFSTFWFPFSHPSMAITFWALAGLLWNHSSKSVSI